MDPLHHHHHHHAPPLHWGYSSGVAAAPGHPQTWVPPPTNVSSNHSNTGTSLSARKLKRAISESDCEDLYSEESSKEQTSPDGSCQMLSRKKRRGVIEKKRRDRINLSLCELKRLVPSAYEKQGSAKLEKAEILQLTVDHLKNVHSKGSDGMPFDAQRFAVDYHIVGFRECASEVARYLVTMEGMDIQDPMRLRLMSHLQCFVAQRELQLKSNGGSASAATGAGYGDLLSPSLSSTTNSSAVANPDSPSMAQSANLTHTTWATPTSYHQSSYQMPTTYQQNAYASQAAAQTGGYVPNLPVSHHQQYDQYSVNRASADESNYETGASTTTQSNSSGRTGVTTRSQASNNGNQGSNSSNTNGGSGNNTSSASAGTSNDVNSGVEPNQPTYTDLTSSSVSSSAGASDVVAPVSTASVNGSVGLAASSAGNNRLQSNYNIYGHIHYPAETFGGHPHHHQYHLSATGYNLTGSSLHSDPSRGYNVGGQSNGNSKPYRPWGAEMAY